MKRAVAIKERQGVGVQNEEKVIRDITTVNNCSFGSHNAAVFSFEAGANLGGVKCIQRGWNKSLISHHASCMHVRSRALDFLKTSC